MTAICGWSNVAKWFPWPYLWPGSLPGPPSFDSHATKVQNSRRKQAVRDRAPLTFHFSWSKIIRSLLLFCVPSGRGSGGGNPPPCWPIERCSADNIAPQAQPQIETALFEPVMDTEIDRARTILRKGLLICGGRSACSIFVYRVNCDPYPRIGNRCNASSTTPSPSFRPVSFSSLSRWTRGRLDEVFSFLDFFFFFFGSERWIFNRDAGLW